MKWKRIKCFLTGGHHLYDKNLQTIHNTNGYHFINYYVPYEKRTKENDWYGKDMVLDNEQAKQLADYAVKKEVYNWDGVEWIVTEALAHGNKVVINADW